MLSVLTLVRGRSRHLANVIRGLEKSTRLPDELVIVHMNEDAAPQQSVHFPIRMKVIRDLEVPLPLAAARNLAATTALGDTLVFLDVDCIPAPELLERYHQALLAKPDALHQGEVRYLPADANANADANAGNDSESDGKTSKDPTVSLMLRALPHPLHAHYVDGQPIPYPLFWSLSFACRRTTFSHIGQFDERYRGYGAEDTDFAFRAREARVPLYRCDALAYHQYHASYSPPLNHFDSIVANARIFKTRWGHWPMEGWLNAFAQRGLLTLTDDDLIVLRHPCADEVAASITFPTDLEPG
jgi:GT2 family glycosyltransferase